MPAADVLGVEYSPWFISGIVRVRVRGGQPIRVMSKDGDLSQGFADGVNGLIIGRR